jgi:mannitol/fructose-specific phosphotransferase system IIA component (Ntr-type)
MRLTDLLKPENVLLPIKATDKDAVIGELVALLDRNGQLRNAAKVEQAVLERERTRTTGIGEALAIPHGKTTGVDELVMAMGRCQTPVDFGSDDGRPVSLVWLLASPSDATGPHLMALRRVSKIVAKADVRKKLLAADSPSKMYQIVSAEDETL